MILIWTGKLFHQMMAKLGALRMDVFLLADIMLKHQTYPILSKNM